MRDYVIKKFHENLEMDQEDYPDNPRWHAAEQTKEDCMNEVCRIVDTIDAEYQEQINLWCEATGQPYPVEGYNDN